MMMMMMIIITSNQKATIIGKRRNWPNILVWVWREDKWRDVTMKHQGRSAGICLLLADGVDAELIGFQFIGESFKLKVS